MAAKIRLGLIGANVHSPWGSRSHVPALLASPDFELTAVCTTKPESAEAARIKYGARLAFHDYREMLASPEVDAVAIVLRVPSHYEPTTAALKARKHVFTEWPLGKNTGEALALAALAKAQGVRVVAGLQARLDPALMYMKEQIDAGAIGEVFACHVSLIREGVLTRPSSRTWQRDPAFGANTLTIANGHTIDAMRFVIGDFKNVSGVVSTQAKQWFETDTKQMVDVTAPDHVMVSGHMQNGAVASVHIATVPWAGSGYRMEVYGREGTLVVSGLETPQFGGLRLYGAKGNNTLTEMEVPARFRYVDAKTPQGEPYNVGQLYSRFAQAIRTGEKCQPDFDTAVELHQLIDALKAASDTGRQVEVG